MSENEVKANEPKKEFLRLDVNPEGKRINQLSNGDYQFYCPKGLEIDGKDLSDYSVYLKADRLKDPKVTEKSPDWVQKKLDKGIKEVFFAKTTDEGQAQQVYLSKKDKETGEIDKVNVDVEKFVPAVISQIKANKEYAREHYQDKEKTADKGDRNAMAAATPNEGREDAAGHDKGEKPKAYSDEEIPF